MPPLTYDQAWQSLLAEIDGSAPLARVTAGQIKALGKEPRLMTKYDSRACRPRPLKEQSLFLLPETNSSYHLVRGEDGYCDLDYRGMTRPTRLVARYPIPMETLGNTGSEMSHLDRLFLAGVTQHFVGDEPLYATIRGRRFSPEFSYRIGPLGPVTSRGIQFEVDQGYESQSEIILMEAKTTTPADFLIRQLYFPFRIFSGYSTKKVRCIFLNYSAQVGVYSFFEYGFEEPDQYQSIVLLRQAHYQLADEPPAVPVSLERLLREAERDPLPNAGWELPQADDFSKVLEFPQLVADGFTDSSTMAIAFDFDPRQSSYYRKACQQMGLVTCEQGEYQLTDRGSAYLSMSPQGRTEAMIRAMLSAPIFRAVVTRALERPDKRITQDDIMDLAARHSPISGSTLERRARTVRAWFRWLERALGELQVGDAVLSVE